MKNIMTMCSVVTATAGMAVAGVTNVGYTGPLVGLDGSQGVQGDPSGDSFFVAPGLGNAGGFFLATAAGTGAEATAGGIGDYVGDTLLGAGIFVDSSIVDNGGGNFDVSIYMYSADGSDLAPAGFTDGGGIALDTFGFFMGANGGGSPLDFSGVALTNSATIEIFDAVGPAGGPFDVSGFANFAALGGGWDGSFGVSFGAGSAGAGINAVEFLVNVTVVPAPAGMATLALGGLVATRRRRS